MMRLALLGIALTAVTFGAAVASLRGGDGDAAPAPIASARSTTAGRIATLEQTVRDRPADAAPASELAALYLQRARETGDPSFYGLAQTAADRALAADPGDPQALVVAGGVALAKHDFAAALAIGEQARAAHPDVVAVYGVLVDAAVELGRYDDALAYAQEMLDRRPDYASYSRVSYLRELHGDTAGAIEAMTLAARAAATPFDEAWARVIIGDLHLRDGNRGAAAREYALADAALPGDAMVQAAQARLAIAQGDDATAEALLRAATDARPLPEYAAALGDLLASQGRDREADDQYALVRATQQLFAASGVDTGIELALFEADHGDAVAAYTGARAAYARHPGVYAADALAWAAYRTGRLDEAQTRIAEALRLGTRDPRLLGHADVINAAMRGE